MQIEHLRLVIEESELAPWALRLLEGHEAISGIRVGLESGALVFEGRIRIPFAGEAPFRTVWTVDVDASGCLVVCLTEASAFGRAAGSGFLNAFIMDRIRDRLVGLAGCVVTGDRVVVEPAALLAALPVAIHLRVTSVTIEPGRIVLETA